MNSTLKRRKSIDSQAASISAWCAVFDWPSIVAAFSVSRHGPASSSAARSSTAARSSHGQRDQSAQAAAAASIASCTCSARALVHVGEHVLLVVRHDGLLELAGRDVLAADHERDLDALAAHLLDAPLQALALGAARRVVVDRLVAGRGRTEDRMGAHAPRLRGVDLSHVLWIGGGRGAANRRSPRRSRGGSISSSTTSTAGRGCTRRACPTTEFGSLTLDERWVDPVARADAGVVRDHVAASLPPRARGSARLPDTPLAIVEGPQLFPTSVSAVLVAPDQALFLIPDRAEQEARLLARGPMPGTSDGVRARANATARDLMISARFAQEARELRLTALAADRPSTS